VSRLHLHSLHKKSSSPFILTAGPQGPLLHMAASCSLVVSDAVNEERGTRSPTEQRKAEHGSGALGVGGVVWTRVSCESMPDYGVSVECVVQR
jgi:hypothetical protein